MRLNPYLSLTVLAACLGLACGGNGRDFLSPPVEDQTVPQVDLGGGTITYQTETGGNPKMSLWMWKGDGAPSAIQPPSMYSLAKKAAEMGYHGIAVLHYLDGSKPDEVIYLTGNEKTWGDVLEERGNTGGGKTRPSNP